MNLRLKILLTTIVLQLVCFATYSQCRNVRGVLFHDVNDNCQFEPSVDNALEQHKIAIQGNGFKWIARTDRNGRYNFCVPPGLYQLAWEPSGAAGIIWQSRCNSPFLQIFVDSNRVDTSLKFIALKGKNLASDYSIGIFATKGFECRQGFTEDYELRIKYEGLKTPVPLSFSLTYANDFDFVSADKIPNQISPGILSWDNQIVPPGNELKIKLKFKVLLSSVFGDETCMNAALSPVLRDTVMSNNQSSLCQRIVAAVDPNNKLVYPTGNITEETDELFYQINFQNTGTATAVRVKVIDTIDLDLPIESILIQAVSHPYSFSIEGSTFVWTFDDINLPDSLSDEPNSHGYINYSAKIKKGLAVGDSIVNTAHIIFDFQSSINTNTTITKIVDEVENPEPRNEEFRIYPNPGDDIIWIEYLGTEFVTASEIYNSLGELVHEFNANSSSKIETTNWSSGVYFVRSKNKSIYKKIIVAH